MSDRDAVARQRRFYDSRRHEHLRAREHDHYARKLVSRLAEALGIGDEHRVLEVGAGFGRFTFPLLEHCRSIVALDLSERALDSLTRTRDELGIPAERCRSWLADLTALGEASEDSRFDFVVGFFLLHHMPDFATTIRALTVFLGPQAGMGFLEPNRRNPLFLAQVVCCPDMDWKHEKGMFQLSAAGVERAFAVHCSFSPELSVVL